MTFWRAWHCRNEVIHHKPAPPIESSRRFLNSYIDSLLCIKQQPQGDLVKGKMVVQKVPQVVRQSEVQSSVTPESTWVKPPPGWVKLNVDGSHIPGECTGGAGMVLRDDTGAIIFSSCRFLRSCHTPMEAEIAACLEGTSLALQRTEKPIIVELDCKEGVVALTDSGVNRSSLAGFIEETKRLLHGVRRHVFAHVRRTANMAAHCMAQRGRTSQRTMVWLQAGPDDLCSICENECKNIT